MKVIYEKIILFGLGIMIIMIIVGISYFGSVEEYKVRNNDLACRKLNYTYGEYSNYTYFCCVNETCVDYDEANRTRW